VRRFHGRLRRLEARTLEDSCEDAPLVFLRSGVDFAEGRPPEETRCGKCGQYHGWVVLHVDEPEGQCDAFRDA
jgi:hypothetical protein